MDMNKTNVHEKEILDILHRIDEEKLNELFDRARELKEAGKKLGNAIDADENDTNLGAPNWYPNHLEEPSNETAEYNEKISMLIDLVESKEESIDARLGLVEFLKSLYKENSTNPKFKAGDRIRFKGLGHKEYTISKVEVENNRYVDTSGKGMDMSYTDANFELVKDEPVCDGLEEELIAWHNEHFNGKRNWEKTSGEYLTRESQLDLARHFVQWQKEQTKGKKWIFDDEYYKDMERSFQDGRDEMREQMMNEAAGGVIRGDNAKLWICNNPPSFIFDRFKDGDNVKLIILPKED